MEGSAQAARAPSVVAVVVSDGVGPWFAEALRAVAAQDYANMSVLVLLAGGGTDRPAAVAGVLPDAYVRRLPDGASYPAAVSEALAMVEGASFFLLCHDDCAPAPRAVHDMVEESFRSNAGIVSPKYVHWDDPLLLLHVGQSADKTGAIVERVHDGEIDAGQHDAVREVFVAPGGCTLVRADLLRELGGFSPGIVGMGEDLDLCWRAHLAGARVVVAPAARARHAGEPATGLSRLPDGVPSLQALQRRHELATVLACYSLPHLLRVLPQALALAAGEVVVAGLSGDHRRVRAVLHAWRWNLAHLGAVRERRAAVAAIRVVPDADVRSLQVRGSARLSSYVSRLTHREEGEPFDGRGGGLAPGTTNGGSPAHARDSLVGAELADGTELDHLDDLGYDDRRPRAHGSSRWLATRRGRLAAWALVALVLLFGSRGLLGTALPLVGQYLPFPAWTSVWHQFVGSWQPAGTGSPAPASPALGMLGLLGTLLAGRMGLLQELLVLGCVPIGASGAARLLRPFASARARLAAGIAYLALPLAYDALAQGRWDGLVAYAATPWIVAQVARAAGLAPFGGQPPRQLPAWRRSLLGRAVVLGAIEAAAVAVAPAMSLVVVLVGLGVLAGSLLAGGARRAVAGVAVGTAATGFAAVLLLPWFVATVVAGRGALAVLGLAGGPTGEPGWAALVRMAVGPLGASPLLWLVVAAAVAPLLIARGDRLAWAVRLWSVALAGWLLALVSVKAWAAPFAPSVDVLLAPAAVGLAGAVGLGVAAMETDLAGYRFGWRQAVAALSVAALGVGALPALAESLDGRWGAPASGYAGTADLAPPPKSSGYRVLWLGDPRALMGDGWAMGPGLAYATSVDGMPGLADLWPPASPGAASSLARAVRVAMEGETVELGAALARQGVRYVVVVSSLPARNPVTDPGTQGATLYPAPVGVARALARQEDLATVPEVSGSVIVFEDTVTDPSADAEVARPRVPSWAALLDPLASAWELVAWLCVAAALLGRRRWLDWWWAPSRQRLARRARERRRIEPVTVDGDGAVGRELVGVAHVAPGEGGPAVAAPPGEGGAE